ncbi:hypothetical protein MMC07_007535 [Pseudocyphellaria aurata]|nr:hypothetical protein [Pseudocyphellaria aurata]
MGIRVVARIRPQQQHELVTDVIVTAVENDSGDPPTLVKIPSHKNVHEVYTFAFSSVYDQLASQQSIFDNEVAPTIKHLLNGFDVTIFAYGSTGTGKTHTMRGGKTLAERGIIPRLLSGIYRRGRKIDKDSAGQTTVEITLSYYEIYNDKVFDLFETPEKRTMAGLQLRESNGKTVIVGLTERACESLKDFERLYDQANVNRSTGATKLNPHSSRSHAILCIKVAVTSGDEVKVSTASAIDLAGSEDNRRTENGKERLVESASINKSLFVLAKCVEAISEKQARIPYRESKMTRILSLGQNNGLTLMILNLAPIRAYHLDTLSSLNFANRTKRIEVQEIENEPVYKGCPRIVRAITGTAMRREPLRPLTTTITTHSTEMSVSNTSDKQANKPTKAFSVYSDKMRTSTASGRTFRTEIGRRTSPRKRPSDLCSSNTARSVKRSRPNLMLKTQTMMSKEVIEDIIERKVSDILAARVLDQPSAVPLPEISEEVQRRLEQLEQRIEGKNDGREQGLAFLLMAKQHSVRGEHTSALRLYSMAKEYFPNNAKLETKIDKLRKVLQDQMQDQRQADGTGKDRKSSARTARTPTQGDNELDEALPSDDADPPGDEAYHDACERVSDAEYETASSFPSSPSTSNLTKPRRRPPSPAAVPASPDGVQTPRTQRILAIVNTQDVRQIRLLKGVGTKKAEMILAGLYGHDDDGGSGQERRRVQSLGQLSRLKGVGAKTVEKMRVGVEVGRMIE